MISYTLKDQWHQNTIYSVATIVWSLLLFFWTFWKNSVKLPLVHHGTVTSLSYSKIPVFGCHEIQVQVPTRVPAALSLIGFNDQLVRFGLHEESLGYHFTGAHPSHRGKDQTAQSSYLIHVVSFCWINTASTKDQIYPSWPFPLTSFLQAWGRLSADRFPLKYFINEQKTTPLFTHHPTPSAPPLDFALSYSVVIDVDRGTRHNETFDSEGLIWSERRPLLFFSDSFFFFTLFLYSPAYLPEHVGHVYCAGGHCAVGVINGMMQHSLLLHLRPHTHIYPPRPTPFFFLFVFLNKLWSDFSGAAAFPTLQLL